MGETDLSRSGAKMLKEKFPCIRITRHHCGWAKGLQGGRIYLGEEGWADRLGFLPDGRFFAIEFKEKGAKTNKNREEKQNKFLKDVNNCGGVGLKIDSLYELASKLIKILDCEHGRYRECEGCPMFAVRRKKEKLNELN